MSEHAKVVDGQVVEVVDLDPAIRSSWLAVGNPKALCYLPVTEGEQPYYDPATEALYDTVSVVHASDGTGSVARTWHVRTLTAEERRKTWTALEFLERFTPAELDAIETARINDSVVAAFYRSAMAAQEVVSDDHRTIGGLQYLVAIGVLTPARRDQILA